MKMVTMKIGTKAQADKVLVESLFKPVNGKTLRRFAFCTGHYKPGSYVGKEVTADADSVYALWVERRRDNDGPYVTLRCLTSN